MGEWISWREDFAIHIDRIDTQHRELFRQFNLLGDAVWDGKGREAVGEILHFLAGYTVQHFTEEESMMDPAGYGDYLRHVQAHRDLIDEVTDFVTKFDSDQVESHMIISVVNRLGEWTRDHIRGMDQGLGHFLTSRQ